MVPGRESWRIGGACTLAMRRDHAGEQMRHAPMGILFDLPGHRPNGDGRAKEVAIWQYSADRRPSSQAPAGGHPTRPSGRFRTHHSVGGKARGGTACWLCISGSETCSHVKKART